MGSKSLVKMGPVKAEILVQKMGPKSLAKFWPVTAEIMLIWTNVPRTNVA